MLQNEGGEAEMGGAKIREGAASGSMVEMSRFQSVTCDKVAFPGESEGFG
jgi:hypothetical protein